MELDGLWRNLGTAFTALLFLGAFVAVGGSRTGAWLLLTALAGLVLSHLAISFVAYRRIMRRPWPKVAPLPEDDD